MSASDEIGIAVKRLNDVVRVSGGLAVYVVVIESGGKNESFKYVYKEIDGEHFYKHLFQAITDDIRQDIDPTLSVVPLPTDVVRELFKQEAHPEQASEGTTR